MLKISANLLVLRTREFAVIFITFDEIYLVFTSKKLISSMYLGFDNITKLKFRQILIDIQYKRTKLFDLEF